jgi:hypothetical protein
MDVDPDSVGGGAAAAPPVPTERPKRRVDDDGDGNVADDEREFAVPPPVSAKRGAPGIVEMGARGAGGGDPASPWVDEVELCELMQSKSRMSGHLLQACGHAVLEDYISVVHVAEKFVVAYNTRDNHLYVFDYTGDDDTGDVGVGKPTLLKGSHGYDLDDLPLFSSCGGIAGDNLPAGILDVDPGVVFGVCDNMGRVRVWDVGTGEMVVYFMCTRTPGQQSSVLVSPNAFCVSPTHIMLATAPSDTTTILYHRPWSVAVKPLVDPVSMLMGTAESPDPVAVAASASDGVVCDLLLTKFTGVRCITCSAPDSPFVFWLTTHSGLASMSVLVPGFARAVIPSLDWPSFIDRQYIPVDDDSVKDGDPAPYQTFKEHAAVRATLAAYLARFGDWIGSADAFTAFYAVFRATDDSVAFADALVAVYLGSIDKYRDNSDVVVALKTLAARMPAEDCAVVDAFIPGWVHNMMTAGVLYNFAASFVANDLKTRPDVVLPPRSNPEWPLLCYESLEMSGAHIIPVVDGAPEIPSAYYDKMRNDLGCRRAWFVVVHLVIADVHAALIRDTNIVSGMRRKQMLSLRPHHRPTSLHVYDNRTVAVAQNSVVWTDMGSQVAAPVRIMGAVHGVCLDAGAVVYASDRTIKFIENPIQGVDCAVSTIFLRHEDGESTESYRVTENVPPVSCLARIDGTTVATHGFDNHVLFFRTVNMEFVASSAASAIEAKPGDVTRHLYPPAEPVSDDGRADAKMDEGGAIDDPHHEWSLEEAAAHAGVSVDRYRVSGAPPPPGFHYIMCGGEQLLMLDTEDDVGTVAADAVDILAPLADPVAFAVDLDELECDFQEIREGDVIDGTLFEITPTAEAAADRAAEDAKYKWAMAAPPEGFLDEVLVVEGLDLVKEHAAWKAGQDAAKAITE